jgi:hypothetical protein
VLTIDTEQTAPLPIDLLRRRPELVGVGIGAQLVEQALDIVVGGAA